MKFATGTVVDGNVVVEGETSRHPL